MTRKERNMVIAVMNSENYEWMSLGGTEAEAKEAIRNQWNYQQTVLVHNGVKNKPDIFGNIQEMEKEYDIDIIKLSPGECKFW